MLTKHNVYSVKVMLFLGFGKVFLVYFTSDSVFSSFRGVQDRFSLENGPFTHYFMVKRRLVRTLLLNALLL